MIFGKKSFDLNQKLNQLDLNQLNPGDKGRFLPKSCNDQISYVTCIYKHMKNYHLFELYINLLKKKRQ